MKYLVVCMLLLLTLAGCSLTDPEPNLPPETTTGENTAGFVVNGKKVVLPSNRYSSTPGTGLVYGLSVLLGQGFSSSGGDDYFALKIANIADEPTHSIRLRMPTLINGEGKYILGQSNGEPYSDGSNQPQITLIISGKNIETKWYYSSENSGSITMTRVDNTNYFYAGSFECSLYNKDNPSEIIKITKGRFDIDVRALGK